VSDEFDDLLDEHGVEITPERPVDVHPDGEVTRQSLPAGLLRASDLLGPGVDEDDGDFEPGGRYKGFLIVPEPPGVPSVHAKAFPRRFYVVSSSGTVGLVPWSGSIVSWPWDAGWQADLYRAEVDSLLKDEKKKGK
jgi:hypothetical protein